jgi:molybdenum-dependent DNA-binding transcriptional regulator ModE
VHVVIARTGGEQGGLTYVTAATESRVREIQLAAQVSSAQRRQLADGTDHCFSNTVHTADNII